MHRTIKTFNLIAVCAAMLIALTALPASAQFAKWPAGDETGGALALRAYGSGVIVPAMREAAIEFGRQKGVIVNITAGPVQTWKKQAIRDADLIFADSEAYDEQLCAEGSAGYHRHHERPAPCRCTRRQS